MFGVDPNSAAQEESIASDFPVGMQGGDDMVYSSSEYSSSESDNSTTGYASNRSYETFIDVVPVERRANVKGPIMYPISSSPNPETVQDQDSQFRAIPLHSALFGNKNRSDSKPLSFSSYIATLKAYLLDSGSNTTLDSQSIAETVPGVMRLTAVQKIELHNVLHNSGDTLQNCAQQVHTMVQGEKGRPTKKEELTVSPGLMLLSLRLMHSLDPLDIQLAAATGTASSSSPASPQQNTRKYGASPVMKKGDNNSNNNNNNNNGTNSPTPLNFTTKKGGDDISGVIPKRNQLAKQRVQACVDNALKEQVSNAENVDIQKFVYDKVNYKSGISLNLNTPTNTTSSQNNNTHYSNSNSNSNSTAATPVFKTRKSKGVPAMESTTRTNSRAATRSDQIYTMQSVNDLPTLSRRRSFHQSGTRPASPEWEARNRSKVALSSNSSSNQTSPATAEGKKKHDKSASSSHNVTRVNSQYANTASNNANQKKGQHDRASTPGSPNSPLRPIASALGKAGGNKDHASHGNNSNNARNKDTVLSHTGSMKINIDGANTPRNNNNGTSKNAKSNVPSTPSTNSQNLKSFLKTPVNMSAATPRSKHTLHSNNEDSNVDEDFNFTKPSPRNMNLTIPLTNSELISNDMAVSTSRSRQGSAMQRTPRSARNSAIMNEYEKDSTLASINADALRLDENLDTLLDLDTAHHLEWQKGNGPTSIKDVMRSVQQGVKMLNDDDGDLRVIVDETDANIFVPIIETKDDRKNRRKNHHQHRQHHDMQNNTTVKNLKGTIHALQQSREHQTHVNMEKAMHEAQQPTSLNHALDPELDEKTRVLQQVMRENAKKSSGAASHAKSRKNKLGKGKASLGRTDNLVDDDDDVMMNEEEGLSGSNVESNTKPRPPTVDLAERRRILETQADEGAKSQEHQDSRQFIVESCLELVNKRRKSWQSVSLSQTEKEAQQLPMFGHNNSSESSRANSAGGSVNNELSAYRRSSTGDYTSLSEAMQNRRSNGSKTDRNSGVLATAEDGSIPLTISNESSLRDSLQLHSQHIFVPLTDVNSHEDRLLNTFLSWTNELSKYMSPESVNNFEPPSREMEQSLDVQQTVVAPIHADEMKSAFGVSPKYNKDDIPGGKMERNSNVYAKKRGNEQKRIHSGGFESSHRRIGSGGSTRGNNAATLDDHKTHKEHVLRVERLLLDSSLLPKGKNETDHLLPEELAVMPNIMSLSNRGSLNLLHPSIDVEPESLSNAELKNTHDVLEHHNDDNDIYDQDESHSDYDDHHHNIYNQNNPHANLSSQSKQDLTIIDSQNNRHNNSNITAIPTKRKKKYTYVEASPLQTYDHLKSKMVVTNDPIAEQYYQRARLQFKHVAPRVVSFEERNLGVWPVAMPRETKLHKTHVTIQPRESARVERYQDVEKVYSSNPERAPLLLEPSTAQENAEKAVISMQSRQDRIQQAYSVYQNYDDQTDRAPLLFLDGEKLLYKQKETAVYSRRCLQQENNSLPLSQPQSVPFSIPVKLKPDSHSLKLMYENKNNTDNHQKMLVTADEIRDSVMQSVQTLLPQLSDIEKNYCVLRSIVALCEHLQDNNEPIPDGLLSDNLRTHIINGFYNGNIYPLPHDEVHKAIYNQKPIHIDSTLCIDTTTPKTASTPPPSKKHAHNNNAYHIAQLQKQKKIQDTMLQNNDSTVLMIQGSTSKSTSITTTNNSKPATRSQVTLQPNSQPQQPEYTTTMGASYVKSLVYQYPVKPLDYQQPPLIVPYEATKSQIIRVNTIRTTPSS